MQKRQQMAQAQAHYKQQQQQQAARGNVQDMFMPPFKGPHDGPMHHMPPGAPQVRIAHRVIYKNKKTHWPSYAARRAAKL